MESSLAICSILFLALVGSSTYAENASDREVVSQGSMCAEILDFGHSISRGEPNLYPFFVEVKALREIHGNSDSLFSPGHISRFLVHSPSLMFATREKEFN